jgi:hypothetical protein
MYITVLHLLFVAPLLIFVGLMKPQYNWIYYVMLALSVGVFVNFGNKVISQKWTQRTVWYVIHALLFAVLLFFVGWHGKATPNVAYSLLLAVGLAAFSYHALSYLQTLLR